MRFSLRSLLLGAPSWVSTLAIVGISILCSVGALFLLVESLGHGYGPTFGRSLTIAVIAPALVSAPIGGYIVHLLREVERARQHAQALAWHDELTGLLNRRRLIELAERELDLARRSGRPVSAALIDLDDFKRINDQRGHVAGDAVLQAVGQAVAAQLRSSDLVGRWGGEEFAVFLPEAELAAAAAVAERVRIAVAGLLVEIQPGQKIQCTVSIGVCTSHPDVSLDDWLDRADRAMYLAKAAGKNQVFTQADG